jgi:hypothetical protein
LSTARANDISTKLQLMLEEVNQTFGHAKEIVTAAYTQALAEGFSPTEAKHLILSSVKSISPRTIYYYLPNESKDKKMQQLGLKQRALQNCNDKKQINNNEYVLHSNDGRQNKELKSDPFMENLSNELDSRKITKEMYLLASSLEKNNSDGTVQPLVQENRGHGTKLVIVLSEKFADYICNKTHMNRTAGRRTKFNLEHDGNIVTAVRDFSII